jgi:NAD+ synthase (glutamine-hydrolysing)
MAQINPTVGDLAGNVARIARAVERAKAGGADVVVFPELAVTGYPPEDLLLRPHFIDANLRATQEVAALARGIVVLVGFVDRADDVYNAAAACADGRIVARYHKAYLPNYGVFDEDRYFQAGRTPVVLDLGGARIGLTICEDVWQPGGPARDEVLGGGAQIVVNLSSSPYALGKREVRERMLATRASDHGVALIYVNLVGGQDELVFDGHSSAFDAEGRLIARAKGFAEDLVLVDVDRTALARARLRDLRFRQERKVYDEGDGARVAVVDVPWTVPAPRAALPATDVAVTWTPEEEVYAALVLGLADYVGKNGFSKVVIGLSGGIDSALTAAIAADALGPSRVRTVFLPSRYSSAESRRDAEAVAKNLGVRLDVLPIEPIFEAALQTLAPSFAGKAPDVTEENLQSRIRGVLLMALSNKFGELVLSTGNKSEAGVGYATLYGDMAGGLSVIKDLTKELVYALSRDLNRRKDREMIPENILTKAPTAELRADQKDSDSLPEYDVLDPILRLYVEEDASRAEIVAAGYPPEVVDRVLALVDGSEYKRRQAPPGIKITSRAFGKDRRVPITNRYRDR